MRLGGPIFKKDLSIKDLVKWHRQLGFGAAYTNWIEDKTEREEYIAAFKDADIVLAEYGAYCLNILELDPKKRQENIDEICDRLAKADEMGVRCCVMHGGSVEYGKEPMFWGTANAENMSQKSFDTTIEIVQGIIDKVKPQTTKLVLETESYLFPDSPQNYFDIIKAVDRKELAVHLDPVNMTCTPRRYFFNNDFLQECFDILGPHIISCHAKDFNMTPIYATVQITETFIGDGVLDYQYYLKAIENMDSQPTLMIEHLNDSQLEQGLKFIYAEADKAGIVFEGSENRIEYKAEGGAYFAPHEE